MVDSKVVSENHRNNQVSILGKVETDLRLAKKKFRFLLVNFSLVTVLILLDCFNQLSQSAEKPTGELFLAGLMLFGGLAFLTRRSSTTRFLQSVALSIQSGETRRMFITSVHQYSHKGSLLDCWVELKDAESAAKPVIVKIDRGYSKYAVEDLVRRYMISSQPFTPIECLAYTDSKSDLVIALNIEDSLIRVKAGGIKGFHHSLMGTQSTERARRFLDRVAAVAKEARGPVQVGSAVEDSDKKQMTQLLIDSQRDGAVVVSGACALFIALGAGVFFFCLFNESIPLVLRHIILWPLGLALLFMVFVPLLSVSQLSEAEKIARITEKSTPREVLLTRIFLTSENNADEYWIDYRSTNLDGSPDKRVRLELFNIVGQRDFIEGLSRECERRKDADGHVALPAKIFADPATQEPVAVVIDGLLFPFDRASFTSTCAPSQRFPHF
ncbi:MAG: hypothetical protein K2Z81_24290 [Cyanobacteria bacterium]|nr:hypothetical protein [Cyanobacteriota bacterium]